MSAIVLHLITYAAFLTFVVAVGVRFYKINNMPIHIRWELYPVAHEGKRAHYGGSYFEELDWWTKPRKFSWIGELKGMVPEMLFIKALWEHNRSLWYRSFPFHFGLYCLIGWAGLLVVGAVAQVAGIPVGPGASAIGTGLHYLTILAGAFGLILATIGAAALLHRRLTDEEFEGYTSPSHIFNLGFFLVALLTAFFTYILVDQTFSVARGYIQSLLTFKLAAPVGSRAVAAEFLLFSLLLAYVPLTHMSHFFTKYFFYHKIRWEDEPNIVGSKMEKQIQQVLNYPVSWSAPHIKGDGKKTWADVATEEVTADDKKKS
jgi:nitrate reductase gamma subunit